MAVEVDIVAVTSQAWKEVFDQRLIVIVVEAKERMVVVGSLPDDIWIVCLVKERLVDPSTLFLRVLLIVSYQFTLVI